MIDNTRRLHGLFLFAVILLASSFPSLCLAKARVVDNVEILNREDGAEIHIFFNFFFQYVTHTPTEHGDYLQIQLRPVQTSGFDENDITTTERLNWEASQELPLTEITYDGEDPTLPLLKLRFTQEVRFLIEKNVTLRSMVIFIPAQPKPLAARRPTPVASQPEKEIAPTKIKKAAPKTGPHRQKFPLSARYAVQLFSRKKPVPQADLPPHPLLKQYLLYKTDAQVGNVTWYRWRLGFFQTKEEADAVQYQLLRTFPNSWVVRVSKQERKQHQLSTATEPSTTSLPPLLGKKLEEREVRPLKKERLDRMLKDAERAMTAGNYRQAIRYYSRILLHPDPEIQKTALEFLGLAREKNGQLAHAKALYEEYLLRYPKDEGAQRVQQRLSGLLTARAKPKQQLRKAKKVATSGQLEKDIYGSLSQYYYYDESKTDGIHSENINSLTSDIDITGQLKNSRFDSRLSFIGSNENDFTEDADDEARVSVLNIDILDLKYELYSRFGRQSVNNGGVLGRFDGGLISYQLSPKIKINTVFGYPVASTRITDIDTTRNFYGINVDLGTYLEQWDFNIFYINQEVDNITDRRAIGFETRYYDPRLSFFSLVDYDIFYDRLNTMLFSGTLAITAKTSVNATTDYRRSPLLSTSNALYGQSAGSIKELLQTKSEDTINRLAVDRTGQSTSMLLGVTHTFNEKWQMNGDVTQSRFIGTPASGGVAAVDGTGYEYSYNLQVIGNSLTKSGDILILGTRYTDLDTRNTITVSLNTRYPVTRDLRLSPRALYEYRTEEDGDERNRYSVRVRINYRLRKNIRLELEGGTEVIRETTSGLLSKTLNNYITLGHRIIF